MPCYTFVSLNLNLLVPPPALAFPSHTVHRGKDKHLMSTANNLYLALVRGGSQVRIVLHREEADEHSLIKMFQAA